MKEVIRAWIFSHGNHQLNKTDNAVLVLVMTMKIATKERIFNSLPIVDLSNWTASQCLRRNFSKSTPNQIKTKIERTHGYKIFYRYTFTHVYKFQYLCWLMTKKESKSSGNKGLDDKAGSYFIVVVVVAVEP